MNHSFTKKSCTSLALMAALVLALIPLYHSSLSLTATGTNRAFTLKAAQNQAAIPANGIGTTSDIYQNTTIEGASDGAYVNTQIWRIGGSFAYGDKALGIWASYYGTDATAYIQVYLEIHNPLTVSGQYCQSEGINHAPSISFYPGSLQSHGTSLGNSSLGDNLSTSLQSFSINVSTMNLSQTPNLICFMVELNHTNGDDVRITLDNLSVTYAC